MKPRVVFDCMVFLQAAGNENGPAGKCIWLAERGEVQLCVSNSMLLEIRDVLSRPTTLKRFPRLTPMAVNQFLRRATRYAEFVSTVPNRFSFPRDPKDEKYVNLALAANAKLLVSRDNDLLELMGDETFRTNFPALTILDPVAFLQTLPNDPTQTN